MTQTREIDRRQWKPFLEELSRLNLGRRVRVEVLRPGIGIHTEARDLPLVGIMTDHSAEGSDLIEVIVGDSPAAHLTHPVSAPEFVHVVETDGIASAVQIVSGDGTKTLVHLNRPTASATPQAFA